MKTKPNSKQTNKQSGMTRHLSASSSEYSNHFIEEALRNMATAQTAVQEIDLHVGWFVESSGDCVIFVNRFFSLHTKTCHVTK